MRYRGIEEIKIDGVNKEWYNGDEREEFINR
jgi:hypothetical protein